jgi:serine phosphatase RsbU (regulator of sigma subunit)
MPSLAGVPVRTLGMAGNLRMALETEIVRKHAFPSKDLWRRWFRPNASPPATIDPFPCKVPHLRDAEIAAVYHDQRLAGDFYEFVRVEPSRLVFALLDMAGRRVDTRDTLRAVQKTLREAAPWYFSEDDCNETTAMMGLCGDLNHTILAGGVRACPGFLGCYHEEFGTLTYANAGHTPALIRDSSGTCQLEATGLPLGLFSHLPQSASTCFLMPEAALLVVSRGIVEAERNGKEFQLQSVRETLEASTDQSAYNLCSAVLGAVEKFAGARLASNDVTALALVRHKPAQRG